jgi:hypothetical protein
MEKATPERIGGDAIEKSGENEKTLYKTGS